MPNSTNNRAATALAITENGRRVLVVARGKQYIFSSVRLEKEGFDQLLVGIDETGTDRFVLSREIEQVSQL
ncbi:MAG: hypothetical protein U9R77_09900 [Pseudomonadota bacterium]|nr:hypothetical protein [Pseudomonadota bacterium]